MSEPPSVNQQLYDAVQLGEREEVRRLLKLGADPCWRRSWPSEGDCALHVAVSEGHGDVMEILLQAGAVLSQSDDRTRTALHRAAEAGQTLLLKRIIQRGMEVNICDWDGVTPLHLASAGGHYDCVRLLLENKADPERNSSIFGVPLITAAGYNHVDCMKLLLHHGANINAHDNDLSQATHAAANFDHAEALKLLLDNDAEFDGKDEEGRSPLFLAAENENHECISLLVTKGGDCIEAASTAAKVRQWRTVELLLHKTDLAPGPYVMLRAINDVRLSLVALCIQRGVWPEEGDIVAYLVMPVSRQGDLYHNDAVEEEWLAHIYTDSRLGDLIELLNLLHKTGLISSRTLCQQRDSLGIIEPASPLSLKCVSSSVIRRTVREECGEVYRLLGLPHTLEEFVACQHIVEQFECIPAINWESDSD